MYPLYCLFHLTDLHQEEDIVGPAESCDAQAVLYTAILGVFLPLPFLYPALFSSCTPKARQYLIAAYRASPFILALFQPITAWALRSERKKRSLSIEESRRLVRLSLLISGVCAALGHIYALSVGIVSSRATLEGIFSPFSFTHDSQRSLIAKGAHLFLQNDWIVITAAFVPYVYYHEIGRGRGGRRRFEGKLWTCGHFLKLSVAATAMVLSPGALFSFALAVNV